MRAQVSRKNNQFRRIDFMENTSECRDINPTVSIYEETAIDRQSRNIEQCGTIFIRDGVDGNNGIHGRDGINGVDGNHGKDGVDGNHGKDGVDGNHGKDGVDGNHGKDGMNGMSITEIEKALICDQEMSEKTTWSSIKIDDEINRLETAINETLKYYVSVHGDVVQGILELKSTAPNQLLRTDANNKVTGYNIADEEVKTQQYLKCQVSEKLKDFVTASDIEQVIADKLAKIQAQSMLTLAAPSASSLSRSNIYASAGYSCTHISQKYAMFSFDPNTSNTILIGESPSNGEQITYSSYSCSDLCMIDPVRGIALKEEGDILIHYSFGYKSTATATLILMLAMDGKSVENSFQLHKISAQDCNVISSSQLIPYKLAGAYITLLMTINTDTHAELHCFNLKLMVTSV